MAERPVAAASTADCPFCPGNESITPPEIYTRTDDAGRWRVRVVPNKFPAVAVDEPAAAGAHEVVIESPRHVDRMSKLSAGELADVLVAYRERLAHWRSGGRFQFGLVFKNFGAAGGASLSHVHSQIMALPHVPPPVAAEHRRAQQSLAEHGTCPYCRLIADERREQTRIVDDRDGLIAFCPYVSRQPHEVWLMPAAHEPWFEHRPETDLAPLASVLRSLLVRVEAVLPVPAYNLLLHTAPWHEDAAPAGHWRIEIVPRANPLAGFELATQIYINPLYPHRAAQQLRSS